MCLRCVLAALLEANRLQPFFGNSQNSMHTAYDVVGFLCGSCTRCPECLRKFHSSERNPRDCPKLDMLISSIVSQVGLCVWCLFEF